MMDRQNLCGVGWPGARMVLTMGLGRAACEWDQWVGEALEELGHEIDDADDPVEDENEDAP